MKSTFFIQMSKNMLRIQVTQNISDILWIIFGNDRKCILNCVSWFVSVILSFNALCNAYTVRRQNYTEAAEYFA